MPERIVECPKCGLKVLVTGPDDNETSRIDSLAYGQTCHYADEEEPNSFSCPELRSAIGTSRRDPSGNSK